jgi:hypothetical protein
MNNIREFAKHGITQLLDLFIIIYIKGRQLFIMLYYYYLNTFLPVNNIIYASSTINNREVNVLNKLVLYYEFDEVYSCASLQRWFRQYYKLNIDNIKFIYVVNGRPFLRRYDLENDEGLKKEVLFDGELEYIHNSDVSIE